MVDNNWSNKAFRHIDKINRCRPRCCLNICSRVKNQISFLNKTFSLNRFDRHPFHLIRNLNRVINIMLHLDFERKIGRVYVEVVSSSDRNKRFQGLTCSGLNYLNLLGGDS